MQALQAVQITNEQQIVSTVSQLCEAASSVVILSREDLSEATDLVKLVKTRAKEIEEERTRLVKPFNDGVKQINARFKQMLEPLDSAERDIKAKMLTFQQDENRKSELARQAAERKAAEEAARVAEENKGPPEAAVTAAVIPLLAPSPPKTTYGQFGATSTVKKVWAYELLDIAALAAARPDLVMVDAGRVNAEIRGKGGEIPGLRVFEKETIAIR
jgi:hypothetical protein